RSVFLLACWQTLLWRLTGQSDFVVSMACDGRTYEGLQEAVGLFCKALPVPSHLEGDLRFSGLLQRTNQSVHDAFAWQEYFSWEHIAGSQPGGGSASFLAVGFEYTEEPAKYSAAGV